MTTLVLGVAPDAGLSVRVAALVVVAEAGIRILFLRARVGVRGLGRPLPGEVWECGDWDVHFLGWCGSTGPSTSWGGSAGVGVRGLGRPLPGEGFLETVSN